MLLLCEAVKPEVFAEAHLGDKLAILREMIVKMLRLQVFRRTFQITNVESNVEVGLVRIILWDLVPAKLFHGSSIERLCVVRLHNYSRIPKIFT